MDKRCTPHSPLTTRLSGSARETENRIRNIFQWKKKRPPALVLALAAFGHCFVRLAGILSGGNHLCLQRCLRSGGPDGSEG